MYFNFQLQYCSFSKYYPSYKSKQKLDFYNYFSDAGVSLNFILIKITITLFTIFELTYLKKIFLVKQINSLALYFFQNLNNLGQNYIKNRRARGPRLTPNYFVIHFLLKKIRLLLKKCLTSDQ